MKRLIIQIGSAILLWLAVLLLCMKCFGAPLTLYFEQPPDAEGLTLRFEPEGIVSCISRDVRDGEVVLRFAGLRRGEANVTLQWDGVADDGLYASEIDMKMHVLPLGIVTDSLTWNFTGWEYMVICLMLFCLTLSVLLYMASRREQKRLYFSYRSIRLLGLALFFFVVSFLRVEYAVAFLRGRNAGTVWSLVVGVIASAQTFLRWTSYVLGFFAVLTAVSNTVLMRHEGVRPANMLGIAVSALIVGGAWLGIQLSWSRFTFPMRNILCNVYAGLFVYFECLLAATVIRALEAGRHEPAYDKDYVIVLGCRIRPDGTLYPLIRGRVDRAIRFVRAQYDATGSRAILVPSGGKGMDEPISEAEAMARYMAEQGIPEDEILVEARSSTTNENLRFSRNLIPAGAKAAFSTSSYHVCRGGILAGEMGWNLDGMGSRTRWYFWPNAFLREFIGLLAESWIQQLTAIAVIALLSAMLTMMI